MIIYLMMSPLVSTCHCTDYDFVNQSGQLYFICEGAGRHIGNSKVGFELPEVEQEGTTFNQFDIVL